MAKDKYSTFKYTFTIFTLTFYLINPSQKNNIQLNKLLVEVTVNGDLEKIKSLISLNADVNYISKKYNGKSLIEICFNHYNKNTNKTNKETFFKIIELLVSNNAKVDFKMETAYYVPSFSQEDEDLFKEETQLMHILEYQIYKDDIAMVKLLIPFIGKESLKQILFNEDFDDTKLEPHIWSKQNQFQSAITFKMVLHALNLKNLKITTKFLGFNFLKLFEEYIIERKAYCSFIKNIKISFNFENNKLDKNLNKIITNYVNWKSDFFGNGILQFTWYIDNYYQKDLIRHKSSKCVIL